MRRTFIQESNDTGVILQCVLVRGGVGCEMEGHPIAEPVLRAYPLAERAVLPSLAVLSV